MEPLNDILHSCHLHLKIKMAVPKYTCAMVLKLNWLNLLHSFVSFFKIPFCFYAMTKEIEFFFRLRALCVINNIC